MSAHHPITLHHTPAITQPAQAHAAMLTKKLVSNVIKDWTSRSFSRIALWADPHPIGVDFRTIGFTSACTRDTFTGTSNWIALTGRNDTINAGLLALPAVPPAHSARTCDNGHSTVGALHQMTGALRDTALLRTLVGIVTFLRVLHPRGCLPPACLVWLLPAACAVWPFR